MTDETPNDSACIHFMNKEPIDLDVIRLMGINIKVTESPIGFFGTGLKFAIATLLRNRQLVSLIRDGELFTFGTVSKEIRGRTVEIVTMNGEELAFTTDLGRNWKVWQAYRELHSNTLDEGGTVSDTPPENPEDFGTLFVCEGGDIFDAYHQRGDIFLEGDPIEKCCEVEFHEGKSTHGFFRGIRALAFEDPSLFTYNVTARLELTEDRTIKNAFMYDYHVERAIARLDDYGMLEEILLASDFWEGSLSFQSHSGEVSAEFLEVCAEHEKDSRLNNSALQIWKAVRPPKVIVTTVERLETFEDKVKEVTHLLATMGVRVTGDDFVIVESLPGGRFADIIEGRVVLDKALFDEDTRKIAEELFKRFVCAEHDVSAYSYEHMEYVLETLFDLGERMQRAIDGRKIPLLSGGAH